MIFAEIRKKYKSEDILTSNAFGLMTLLPDSTLLSILSQAINNNNKRLLSLYQYDKIEAIKLWPRTNFGEPDIKLIISNTKTHEKTVLLIEIKYESGKSGSAYENEDGQILDKEIDQLAKYWSYLEHHFENLKDKSLIYITASRFFPKYDIEISYKATNNKGNFYWLSWFDLCRIIKEKLDFSKKEGLLDSSEHKILILLYRYLRHKNFLTFSGWNMPNHKEYDCKWFYRKIYFDNDWPEFNYNSLTFYARKES